MSSDGKANVFVRHLRTRMTLQSERSPGVREEEENENETENKDEDEDEGDNKESKNED